MKQLFLSLITIFMVSIFLSGCIIAEEEPIADDVTDDPNIDATIIDEFGIHHVPTIDAPALAFSGNSLRHEFTEIFAETVNKPVSFDLPALAVQHNNDGGTKTISTFIDPVFSVSYHNNGTFKGISEAMTHIGDKKYGVFDIANDGTETYIAMNDEIKGAGSNDSAKLTINHSPFGFAFNNMLSVEWELHTEALEGEPANTASTEHGYMIAGATTHGVAIPITGEAVTFEGKGKGKYDSLNDVDFTSFNVTANINFSARHINLSTSGTKNAGDESLADLDFTSILKYSSGTNNISGNVSTNGMSGIVDARFYSARLDNKQATELGGTFAMRNDESVSYIGMFGAADNYVSTTPNTDQTPTEPKPTPKPSPPTTITDNIDIVQVATIGAPDAITDIGSLFFNASVSLQENTAYDVTLSALAVQQNDSGTAKTVSN
nr:hypothetical protein [Alphaproteobacteria bacterium]